MSTSRGSSISNSNNSRSVGWGVELAIFPVEVEQTMIVEMVDEVQLDEASRCKLRL